MRARGYLFIPALVLLAGSAGCPRIDESPPPPTAISPPLASPAPLARIPEPPPPERALDTKAAVAIAVAPDAPPVRMGSMPEPSSDLPDPLDPIDSIDATDATEPPDPPDLPLPLDIPEVDPPPPPPELADDVPEDPPEPEPEPPKQPSREVEELASIARETWVYAEPRWGSRRLGYLRAGAVVERRAKPSGTTACSGGWYHIEPRGYVCVGASATLNIFDPVVETSARRPAMDSLPYTYVMSRSSAPPPLYARLPSDDEQRRIEPDLRSHLARAARAGLDPAYFPPPPPDPTPGVLIYGRAAPGLGKERRAPDMLSLGTARPRSAFALLSTFDHEGRRFGLTTDLAILPLDRTRVVRPSTFSGIALSDEVTLPVAFVRSRHASRYVAGPGGALARGQALRWREAVPLATGPGGASSKSIGDATYLLARDGSWVRADQVVRVDRTPRLPGWAARGRRWIDVSILRQSLVAYEGAKPVYATLVSTGADGLGDPKETHSTIQGAFLIHTKHVTVTMDGENGEEFDFRDVPFVQFFTEGFALHGAYWHDDFGTPRSHGCVNLAPIDAAWLFGWTTPEVPDRWHAVLSRQGTVVYTHP